MSLFSMFLGAIERGVSDAMVRGAVAGTKRILADVQPQGDVTLEIEEAQALLLAFQPAPEEPAPVKGRRKAE